ncbi:O-methyltransferase [Macleaya cordata]|uniref:O-methyltransferase n=1 Tax=Macleaya cordata TaxID=56857 RepID=A0A200R0G2_MACCD|nr:O-methyltransferase [Macleaya cordata]
MEVKKSDQANQAKTWKLIYGFAESQVLKCAVELDIAGTIHNHGQPMTLSELASQLPAQPVNSDRLYRVMRYLVHMKLFTKENVQGEEMRYGLAPSAKYLIKGWEKSIVPSILSLQDKVLMRPWNHLKDAVIGDCTAFEKVFGKNLWVYLADHPDKNKIFNESMACNSRLLTSALVHDCKSVFEGLTSLVDCGGGTGTAAKAIFKAFPHIKCSVYDLPHVIADSPSDPDIVRIAGDMFKFIPSADAILLKWILHDWDDNECIQILKLCKEVVPREGGKVIIVDIVLNVNSKHPFSKMRLRFDLGMMLRTGGKERTEEEWKKLIHAAGFTSYKITHISAIQSCILHDWNDDECIQILKKCKEALPREGGKVIIVDVVLDMDMSHPYSKIRFTLDLDMMLNTGGKERTVEEWKKLIDAAGFASYKITQISAVQSVIEAYPY